MRQPRGYEVSTASEMHGNAFITLDKLEVLAKRHFLDLNLTRNLMCI